MSNLLTVDEFMSSGSYIYYVVSSVVMIGVSVCGLMANFTIILIACISRSVTGNYRWPIANMAFFDAIFAFCGVLNGDLMINFEIRIDNALLCFL